MIKKKYIEHRGDKRIRLIFSYDEDLIQKVRGIPGAKWSQTLRSWHVPDTSTSEEALQRIVRGELNSVSESPVYLDVFTKQLHLTFYADDSDIEFVKSFMYYAWVKSKKVWRIPNFGQNIATVRAYFGKRLIEVDHRDEEFFAATQELEVLKRSRAVLGQTPAYAASYLEEFKKWMRVRRYSEASVKSYEKAVRVLLTFLSPKKPEEIENQDLIDFLHGYLITNGYSYSYQNQVINAAKLFFREVLHTDLEVEKLERPRPHYKLPNVLSREEVRALLEPIRNVKHKTALSLIYACGLRRSELLNLHVRDIDSDRHLLIVRQSKGNRDRLIPISDNVISVLREYYKIYRPKKYLFEGIKEGKPYSAASLDQVLKAACRRSGIEKPVTLHWLRHSYATHLLESGTDLRYIQELLGHKSSRTTEIYTHVSQKSLQKIRTPFDDLFKND